MSRDMIVFRQAGFSQLYSFKVMSNEACCQALTGYTTYFSNRNALTKHS